MKIASFTLLLLHLFLGIARAQPAPDRLPGELLVSLRPGQEPGLLVRRWAEASGENLLAAPQAVSPLLRIWLLRFDTAGRSDQEVLNWCRDQPEVQSAQFHHRLHQRSSPVPPQSILPDDPLFAQQWQYQNNGASNGLVDADLDAEQAWDLATGGLTPAGDTIVVAVIDGGVDAAHPDLAGNLWVNWAEIPADGLDNDANGYTDDVRGWNVYAGNDDISGNTTSHGTPVSGIVGARGDNGIGVAGVNWQVKLMFVAGSGQEASILAAYDYVLQSRRRYNASNGQQGAFVVAVNCSWGVNYGQPAEAPLWCAAFDSLGAAGVLSTAATANLPLDVDVAGDLPTGCGSDFLVTVTSLDRADQKATNAAWGATTVDLGAYGQEVFTLNTGGGYGPHSGTSFAAPHVGGAIALLYSEPCPNLIALAKTDPAGAALWAKDLLLGSVTPNDALQEITLTSGRLNLHQLLENYASQCSPCPPPFALQANTITATGAALEWSEIDDYQAVILRWRLVGQLLWNYLPVVQQLHWLENLQPCSDYEFAVFAACSGGLSSAWSEPFVFTTDGCCLPPAMLGATDIAVSTATLSWNALVAAQGYRVRWRPLAGGSWTWYDVGPDPGLGLTGLQGCTDYEAQVQTLCDTGSTAFSTPYFFKTAGCGACTDALYCPAAGGQASVEWIAAVQIGDWLHESGGGPGYQDFTGILSDQPALPPSASIPITITPGYNGLPYKEYFRVFIDFNADGDFDDAGELAFDPGYAHDGPISGFLTVPALAAAGVLTRLRVVMKYKNVQDTLPGACELFEFGQVEDYCVRLSDYVGVYPVGSDAEAALRFFPQPASDHVWLEWPVGNSNTVDIMVWNAAGVLIHQQQHGPQVGLLLLDTSAWPAGIYAVRAAESGQSLRGKLIKLD